MVSKTVTYEDFDGNTRTEELYFHMSKIELTNKVIGEYGMFDEAIEKMIKIKDITKLMLIVQDIIKSSYGKKSDDGKRFMKEDPVTGRPLYVEFVESPAYEAVYMDLASDVNKIMEFIRGIMPKDVQKQYDSEMKKIESEDNAKSISVVEPVVEAEVAE